MTTQTVASAYQADLKVLEELDRTRWTQAHPDELTPAMPSDLDALSLEEVVGLSVAADELEPYARP